MTAPSHPVLGRGVVVTHGGRAPAAWSGAPVVTVDDAALVAPGPTLEVLHRHWVTRTPVVIELAVEVSTLRQAEVEHRPPHELDPGFGFDRERLHFLVWANTYDARSGDEPVWWHAVKAARLDPGARVGGPADLLLADATPVWCDGGPRGPVAAEHPVVHRDSIDAGRLSAGRNGPATAALAPDQLAAVSHAAGPARVIAPAGSGKTRVLTERIRHLVRDRGVERDLITAVAYNVKAADELRERTAGFAPTIRTLNSLGLAVCQLRSSWRTVDEREQRTLLDQLVTVPKAPNTDPMAPYLEALTAIRLGLRDPEAVEADLPDAAGIAQAFPEYRRRLLDQGLLDFDEQIYLAVELLLTDPDLRSRARATARTLLVDEMQDLTPAHLLLVRLLAGPAGDVFGVGDDDQVIYGYAGADPGFLVDFERYFPGASSYQLSVNYRCPPAVVDGARTLLGYNRRRIPKDITAAPQRPPDPGALRVVRADQPAMAAADAVAQRLDSGADATQIAVLARVQAALLPVQVVLTERGLPCIAAVGPDILRRSGMEAALAYLRIGDDPGAIRREDVRATIRRPSRKIAPKVVDMITKRPTTSLRDLDSLAAYLTGRDADKVSAYADDLRLVVDAVAGGTVATALQVIGDDVGLASAMSGLDHSKGGGQQASHGDDLAALTAVATLHPEPDGFETWLRATLAAAAGSGVTLATVHRVKGREWPHVVVLGVSAGVLPHRLSDDVEEERRIFHVALTRGIESVIVVADAKAPSPFLDELAGTARAPAVRAARPTAGAPARAGGSSRQEAATTPAVIGMEVALAGGHTGSVIEVDDDGVTVRVGSARRRLPFGAAVRIDGRSTQLVAPSTLAEAGFEALRAWRLEQAAREARPAFMVLSDAHLRGIAARRPTDVDGLARCAGIGPKKLEDYGDAILTVLEGVSPRAR